MEQRSRRPLLRHRSRASDRGHTNWRRTAFLALPGLVVLLVLAVGTLEGAVPARLALYDIDVRLSGNLSAPQGLQGYTGHMKFKNGKYVGALIASIPQADFKDGACLSLSSKLPVIGRWTVQIHSNSKVQIVDATLDASSLSNQDNVLTLNPKTSDGNAANADGSNVQDPIVLGKDSGAMPALKAKPGEGWGLDVQGPVTGKNLDASARGALIAGTLTLGLPTITLHSGQHGMNVCAGKTSSGQGGGS